MSFHLLVALLLSSGSALDQSQDMVVKKGDNVTLDCSQKNSNYVNMYWYKQERKTHAQLQLVIYSTGNSDVEKEFKDRFKSPGTQNKRLSLICEGAQPADTGTYFCAKQDRAAEKPHFGQGTRLTVLEVGQDVVLPEVTVFAPPKQEVDEKEKATIVCLVTDFFPDHVALSWSVNNEMRTAGVKTEDPVYDTTAKRYSMTSRLRITKEEWQNSDNKFVCKVSFHGIKGSTDHEDSINGADCGGGSEAARESYLTEANLGKLVYILLILKSALYGAFVMGLKLRKKLAL